MRFLSSLPNGEMAPLSPPPEPVEGGALRTPVGIFSVPEIAEGERAVLCLRQRAIELTAPGKGLAARIIRTKPLGDATLVDLAVQGFEGQLRARIRESELPTRQTEVGILVDPDRVLVFPADEADETTPTFAGRQG